MEVVRPTRSLLISSHASSLEVTAAAAHAVCDGVDGDGVRPDLVVAFFGSSHVPHAEVLGAIVRERLGPKCLVGVSAEGVICGPSEFERSASGMSVFAAALPGASVQAFHSDDLPAPDETAAGMGTMAASMGVTPTTRGVLFFSEASSLALSQLVPAMGRAAAGVGASLVGGVASAAKSVGDRLILNDRVFDEGGVGVSLAGAFVMDAATSQGTSAVGPNLVITRAKGGMIFEMGGKPAIDAIRECLGELPGDKKDRLNGGLFVGRAVDEYSERFGRDDFVMRKIIAVRPDEGAIVLEDVFRTGQTVRLHVRDAKSAHEDLQLVLAQQQLKGRPAGGLLISCHSRGQRLFPVANHDAELVCRAFAPQVAGEHKAKGGRAIEPGEPQTIPLCGFFANAEIGPARGETQVHGQSAVMAMFREPRAIA